MRVMITGGTGLIGRALAADLIRDGHEVIVLGRNPQNAKGLPHNVQVVQWDARTPDGWGEWVDGTDAVVNLAGSSVAGDGFFPKRWTAERQRSILESRVYAGKALVEAISQAATKPAVLIQSSAVGYYGIKSEAELTEDDPAADDFLARVCVEWEAATQSVETMGVRRAIIRTGVVLSADGGALPRMALPFRFFAGGPLGSGDQPTPWIHIADEVAAIRFLLENEGAHGAFNLAAPNPLTNREFSQVLGNILKRPAFIPVPGFALLLLFGEVSSILLEGQCAIPKRLLDMGFEFHFPQVEAALRDLYNA